MASVWESITALMARSVKRSKTALTTSGEERRVVDDDKDKADPLPALRSAAGTADPRARRAAERGDSPRPAAAEMRTERDAEARAEA